MKTTTASNISKWIGQRQLPQRTIIFDAGETRYEIIVTESTQERLLVMDGQGRWIAEIRKDFLWNPLRSEQAAHDLTVKVEQLERIDGQTIIEAICRAYQAELWKVTYRALGRCGVDDNGPYSTWEPQTAFVEGDADRVQDFVVGLHEDGCRDIQYDLITD